MFCWKQKFKRYFKLKITIEKTISDMLIYNQKETKRTEK